MKPLVQKHLCYNITRRLVLIRNVADLIHRENEQKCGKDWMFLKASAIESTVFF